MLDEFRIETTSVGQYIDKVEKKKIKADQDVQREFCWSNEMINNLIYSTISKKRIYIPNIILAELIKEDGTKVTYIVDGGQRTEALRRFIKDGHKITKSIRNRYVEYQGIKLDEDGNQILDEYGDPIYEIKEYDLAGKKFDDFPEELKDRLNSCVLSTAIYQDCTQEETSDLVMLYNSTIAMNVSQKSLTYIGKYANKLKFIKENNRFLIDGTMLNENDKKKGNWQRIIAECVMTMFHFDNWKKNPRDICSYLNENAKEEEFDSLNDYFNRLIPYSNKVNNIEVAELFVSKDIPVWMMAFKKAEEYCSDYDFGRFLLAFNDMKEIEANDTTWIELDQDKHTKDKKVILKKVDYIESLLKDFLHIKEDDSVENNEVKESKVDEIQTEEFEKKVEEVLDDSEMETLAFVRKYVNPEITEDDIDDYFEDINTYVKSKIIDKDSEVISSDNENAIIALIAYTYKHDISMDTWLQRYAIGHKTLPKDMSQKERFDAMLHSLYLFTKTQNKLQA